MTQENTGAIADVLPLGPLQEGLLFHHALSGGGDGYNIQVRLELRGPADTARLRRAAAALLERHPNLRAGFLHEELDQPVQFVPADTDVHWNDTDLSALPAPERDAREEEIADAEFGHRFDLAAPPLMRFRALTAEPGRTVLLVTAHHVLLDGWSLPLLVRDLLRLYAGTALPPAPRYRDHLAWLTRRDAEADLRAWHRALDGLAGPTLAVPGAGEAAASPQRIEQAPSVAAGERLRALASRAGTSVNTVVQAVWALTLSARTGNTDVVFGQPVSGRPADLPGAQETVGLFTNTLPVRVRLDPAESVAALLTRLRLEQADLLDHQWAPLAAVQRQAGHGTLFDTLLVVENYPLDRETEKADHAGLRLERVRVRDATHYPATLTFLPDDGPGGAPLLRLDHRPDALPEPEARALLATFTRLLDQACADPERPVRELDPLPAEQHALVRRHNDTAHPLEHTTLIGMLIAAADAHADRTAVVAEDRELTYRELHDEAARLAAVLAEHGAGPETVVAVALPRGTDLVTALLAAVRTGAAYLPLDLDHPPARLADTAARAGAAVLVTTSEIHRDLAPALAARSGPAPRSTAPAVVETDAPSVRERLDAADPLPWARPHPDQLAYTIFTSGSTGRPKGVGITHRALANRLQWTQHAHRLTPGDRVAQKTPVGFDVSVWEFFWPLAAGAAIVPVRPDGHRDPAHLADLFARRGVTVCHFVPSMLRLFLEEPTAARADALRLVVSSGEALPADLARDFTRVFDARLENLYGPTEAAIDVSSHPAADPSGPGTVPIGSPVWNTALYVLDPWLRPVAPGTPGELHLGGLQLARGYTGRPDLTAERFVADPFGPPGSRMYRTGDLVHRRHDGTVVYLGRTDDQVKINGVRVEPGEIEAALTGLEGVAAAAATVSPGRVDGYAVPRPGHDLDPDRLREDLARLLPRAMVPAAVTVLERLPLGVNGKLDRAALPRPAADRPPGRPPATAAEKALCAAAAELLGLDEVAADADFFALGGDSVTSIRLVGRARAAGLELSVRDVFTHRTPERLAAHAAPAAPEPEPEPGPDAFADLLDAGEMDQLQQLWNPRQ
ncbi:non-ribosomal peptide synthetase [Nocardiopsis algeriensis]|uniref:non-ribosomal peptide synthetase n=1 Tax=Nocardiopsis algeriensis TaxID=1478215 RepID=UPI003B432835